MKKHFFKKMLTMLCVAVFAFSFIAPIAKSVVTVEASSITQAEAQTAAVNNLRYGYNVASGRPLYDSGLQKASPILKPISEDLYKYIVKDTATKSVSGGVSSESAQGMAKEMSTLIDVGVNANVYMVSTDISTVFDTTKKLSTVYEEKYDLYYIKSYRDQYYIETTADLKNYVTDEFVKDYNLISDAITATVFLQKYGTHIFTGLRYGGYLTAANYQVSSSSTYNLSQTTSIKSKVEAHMANYGGGASSFVDLHEKQENITGKRTSTYKCLTYGGNGGSTLSIDHLFTYHDKLFDGGNYEYQRWEQSINETNWEVMGKAEQASAIPVWELLPAEPKYNPIRWYLLDAYKELCGDKYEEYCKQYPTESRTIEDVVEERGSTKIAGYTVESNGYAAYKEIESETDTHVIAKGSTIYMTLTEDSIPVESKEWRITEGSAIATVVDAKKGIIKVNESAAENGQFSVVIYSNDLAIKRATFKVAPKKFSGGDGSAQSPYLIATQDDLLLMLSNSQLWGAEYRMVADIDMKGIKMTPIGSSGVPFSGVFDGNHYTISDLSLGENVVDRAVGLFAYNTGTVKNMRLNTVTIEYSASDYLSHVGGVVAYNAGEVSNCRVDTLTVNVTSKPNVKDAQLAVGGVVGFSTVKKDETRSKVSQCLATNLTLYAYNDNSDKNKEIIRCYLGGIIGFAEKVNVDNCYMEFAIKLEAKAKGKDSSARAAGLIGQVGSNTDVKYCVVGEIQTLNATSTVNSTLFEPREADARKRTFIGRIYDTATSKVDANCYALEKTDVKACEEATINVKSSLAGGRAVWSLLSEEVWCPTEEGKPTLVSQKIDAGLQLSGQQTSFYHGESFSAAGMTVKGSYANGTNSEDVTYFNVDSSAYNNQYKAGNLNEYVIKVSGFGGAKAEYTVTVRQIEVVGLAVEEKARLFTTTSVKVGDKPSFEDVLVYYVLENGEIVSVDAEKQPYIKYPTASLRISADAYVLGDNYVTVTCGNLEGTTVISAEENEVVSIEVRSNPNKMNYKSGENFAATGMQVVATYEDGREVIVNNSELEIIGKEVYYDASGVHTVCLLYGDYKSCNLEVAVAAPVVHVCEMGAWETISDATCIAEGVKVRSCSCGEKETASIPATGHTEGDWIVETQATCTEAGYKYKECTVCHTKVAEETIVAGGHTEGDWIVETQATCTEAGYKYIECTVCHTKLAEEEIASTGHAEGNWIVDKEATCTEAGYQYKECAVCHTKVAEETIVASGHTESDWIVLFEATETTNGAKYKECTKCHTQLEKEIIPATVGQGGSSSSAGADEGGCSSSLEGMSCLPIILLSATVFVYKRKREE